jgi:protease I
VARVLIPLPLTDFDPTEAGVPWEALREAGHEVRFATPDGRAAACDPIMLTGAGLGPLKWVLQAAPVAVAAYQKMSQDPAFLAPLRWGEALARGDHDALLLPGGHAQGMKPYLESPEVQELALQALDQGKPLAAICHGVIPVARAARPDGRSALYGRKTTALLRSQELAAWNLTRLWMGDYYRTYPTPVQAEVTAALARPDDFHEGPKPLLRDDRDHLGRGFVVQDDRYLSARWPGDAHRFAQALVAMLAAI